MYEVPNGHEKCDAVDNPQGNTHSADCQTPFNSTPACLNNTIDINATFNVHGAESHSQNDVMALLVADQNRRKRAANLLGPDEGEEMRVNCSEICYLCGVGGESVSHLFTECAVALSCWSMINVNIPVICTGYIDWLSFIMNHLDQTSLSLVLVICWKLWTARNHKLWNNQTSNAKQIVEQSTAFLDAWKKVHASVPVIPTDKNTAH
nr:uncharacterized protein LOC109155154 [Ipomoea trifida]